MQHKAGTQGAQEDTLIGQGMPFERTRRITGYLVGTLDRWSNAKRAEERDRVKHGLERIVPCDAGKAPAIVTGSPEITWREKA